MKNKARFIIINTFRMTVQQRKALIVVGDIAEGFVSAGDTIEFTALGKVRRFIGNRIIPRQWCIRIHRMESNIIVHPPLYSATCI